MGPEVMLAASMQEPADQILRRLTGTPDQWWFEIKFDGIRAVVSRTRAGAVQIWNRRRVDITHRYPDVVAQVAGYTSFVGVADGEIIVVDETGRPDFARAHIRDAQSSTAKIAAQAARYPASFMPFDVLTHNARDVQAHTFLKRHALLAKMFPEGHYSLASQDGQTLWGFVLERRLEGLIAKRADSTYLAGRQKSWVKIKATRRVVALVSGVVAGKGSRGAIGALELSLWDPDAQQLVSIGSVGSGMSDAAMRLIAVRLEAGSPLRVEVEFLEVSRTNQLRMPIFRGIRDDVPAGDCVVASLTRLRAS